MSTIVAIHALSGLGTRTRCGLIFAKGCGLRIRGRVTCWGCLTDSTTLRRSA